MLSAVPEIMVMVSLGVRVFTCALVLGLAMHLWSVVNRAGRRRQLLVRMVMFKFATGFSMMWYIMANFEAIVFQTQHLAVWGFIAWIPMLVAGILLWSELVTQTALP